MALSSVALMFALPTGAAAATTTYAATATGDVWQVNRLDLDMSGNPATTDLSVGRVDGLVGSTASPRAHAQADNIAGARASGQGVRRSAVSNATATTDTTGRTEGSAAAGAISGVLDLASSTLGARGRWTGDGSCVAITDRLTDSRASLAGSNLAAHPIPAEDPLAVIPVVDVPVAPPAAGAPLPPLPDSDAPPVDVPGLPAAPTDSPTLPDPTDVVTIPTTDAPSLPPLPSLPRTSAAAAEGDPVVMMDVEAAAIEQHTWLERKSGTGDVRAVRAEVIGAMLDSASPAVSFFGGEVAVKMAGQPRLTAYADGAAPGKVTWAPPDLTLLVAGAPSPFNVPADGTPVSVNYSGNRQVVLTVSAGKLTETTPTDRVATATASVLHIEITNGDAVVLDADLFPMKLETRAPTGGVDCRFLDTDGDGLTDALEAQLGTDPTRRDTDRDGLSDGKEVNRHRTKPLKPDTDGDRLKDGVEVKKYRTNPRKKDTDGDGVSDYREVKRGTNPLKA